MDASRNKEYLEKHDKEIAESIKDPDDFEASQRRERKIREVYIPEEELKELREMYSCVVVQDFEDEYHMSRKDREALRERYAKFFKLKQNYTKKIRKLDKYIEACRIVLQIVNDTAESNGIMDPDEFRAKTLKGEIRINGLQIPKYVGRGKKSINWDYVMEFILDPSLDPKILMKDTLHDVEDLEEDHSLTESEIESLVEKAVNNKDNLDKPGMVNEEDNNASFASVMTKKDQKLIRSVCPGYEKVIKQINRRNSDHRRNNMMVWELDHDDIKWIEEYDKKQNKKRYGGAPEFSGDITNDADVEAYLFQMEEYERETEMVEYHGSYVSREDYDELKFKEVLERNGYNLRNLYGNKEREKKRLEETKRNRKKIKSLKKMLAQIQEQNSEDTTGLTGEIIKYTKEDLESGGKINKKKKKKSKKAKKKAKVMDDMLLSAVGSDAESMKDYYKEMSSMSLLNK